jgi:hypothetical protein
MNARSRVGCFNQWGVVLCLVATLGFVGFPHQVNASVFTLQTGVYVGTGTDNRQITGVGFQPDLVLIKSATTAGSMIMKTSAMAGELSVGTGVTTVYASDVVQSLDSDGFTVGTNAVANSANIMYYYTAIGNSDCTAAGVFCVGSYTGNGTTQTVGTGFDPDMVWVKRNGASAGVLKSSTMAGAQTNYFANTNPLATQGITALTATGFDIGNNAVVNTNANTYYYAAFKESPGLLVVGSYTGNGVDNRSITSVDNAGLNYYPSAVFVKGAVNQRMAGNIREVFGDYSFVTTATANAVNSVQQLLDTGGFQVGTNAQVNTNATLYHYMVLGGGQDLPAGSGTYDMAQGTYVGTGSGTTLSGLSFAPDLVIIKSSTNQNGVFRTSLMQGDRTAYTAAATANFAGGILSLNSDGFSIGTSATVNAAAATYQWVAFGNASRIDRRAGAADFFVGQYIGNGVDSQDIRGLPIDPALVFAKATNAASSAAWRTTDQVGDTTLFLSATTAAANVIQQLYTDGFQRGTAANANTVAVIYDFFVFGVGDRFTTGTYTGNGAARNISGLPFQPDYLWTKKTTGGTARQAAARVSDFLTNQSFFFANTANLADRITNFILQGFSLGNTVEVNENTFTYQYVGWNNKFYDQAGYRWFNNTDSLDVGAPLAASNTVARVVLPTDPFRLRMLMRVDKGNLYSSAEQFKLQYSPRSGSCDAGFVGESYADVSGVSDIRWYTNPGAVHNAVATSNANDPTDGVRPVVVQSYNSQNPITNSSSTVILDGEDGLFDFSLIADTAPELSRYCLRLVYSDGGLLENYSIIPEVITGLTPQELSFSIADDSVGFGTLSSTQTRYASGDSLGAGVDGVAHSIIASTNAGDGYVIQLTANSLSNETGHIIAALPAVATSSSVGAEQYGLRASVLSGNGSVFAPYNTAGWAHGTPTVPVAIMQGSGDEVSTEFGVHYIANIESDTESGEYSSLITYTISAQY